jgi:hypothetical protein
MAIGSLQFMGYEKTRRVANVVVDGSPNESTVLTLSHWPGQPQPAGTSVDTSAEMAFALLDHADDFEPVTDKPFAAVTNNHFDQDGAVGIFALTDPVQAQGHRELLIDLAHAGDFGTYRFRDAARASMILHAFADPARSPIADRLTGDHERDTVVLYETVLVQLVEFVTDPGRHRQLWAAEDELLTASEEALAEGRVRIGEDVDLDLAVVEVEAHQPERTGHRFGHLQFGPLHPMAVHNATARSRLLTTHGDRHSYVDRYETWVQVHSRRPPQRIDLRPVADELTAMEGNGTTWHAAPPSTLTPRLDHDRRSALTTGQVVEVLGRSFRSSPPAWDPSA